MFIAALFSTARRSLDVIHQPGCGYKTEHVVYMHNGVLLTRLFCKFVFYLHRNYFAFPWLNFLSGGINEIVLYLKIINYYLVHLCFCVPWRGQTCRIAWSFRTFFYRWCYLKIDIESRYNLSFQILHFVLPFQALFLPVMTNIISESFLLLICDAEGEKCSISVLQFYDLICLSMGFSVWAVTFTNISVLL